MAHSPEGIKVDPGSPEARRAFELRNLACVFQNSPEIDWLIKRAELYANGALKVNHPSELE